jgi:ATP-dependent DNA helicase RecG
LSLVREALLLREDVQVVGVIPMNECLDWIFGTPNGWTQTFDFFVGLRETCIDPDGLQEGEKVTIKGKIVSAKNVYTRNRLKIQKVVLDDGTGKIEITWFNQQFLIQMLKGAEFLSVSGEVKRFLNTFTIQPAEYEVLKAEDQERIHTGRLVPIYSEKKGLSTKTIREKMRYALQTLDARIDELEWLPSEIKQRNSLMDEVEAYRQIHFPSSKEMAAKARTRLAFDELFTIQLSNAIIRKEWEAETVGQKFEIEKYRGNRGRILIGEKRFGASEWCVFRDFRD